MFGINTRSLNLLLTIGILVNYSTADKQRSNLRVAKAKLNNDSNKKKYASSNLRASVTSNNDNERRLSSLFNHVAEKEIGEDHSSITLSKRLYVEEESITVSFNLGSRRISPSSEYSIGLFMRDADPQGGTLSPIVSINICNVIKCNDDQMNDIDLDVTFGNDQLDIMKGVWPLENSEYGTGFDAYVLDGQGAAAIGPFEFYIKSQEDVAAAESSTAKKDKSLERFKKKNGLVAKSSSNVKSLMQIKKDAIKEKEVDTTTAKDVNKKIVEGNGLEMSSSAIPQSSSIHKTSQVEEEEVIATSTTEEEETEEDDEVCCSTMTCNKDKYREDEEVSFNFNIVNDRPEDDLTKYKIGFYMRMAHVENLEPIVSLPLCSGEGGCSTSTVDGSTTGSVTFSSETMQQMSGSSWPIDLYEWGTGIDAYVLDESGNDVVGPVKFDFLMNDTY